MTEPFGKSYFTRGNYAEYLKRKFDGLAADLVAELGLCPDSKVIDFGCGYGGLVRALSDLGLHSVFGTDISSWAIEYGKRQFPQLNGRLQHYNREMLSWPKDALILLDVLEHMPDYEIDTVLKLASECLQAAAVAVRVPVSAHEGEAFVLDVSNNDATHIACHTKDWWGLKFAQHGMIFQGPIARARIYDSPGVLAWRLDVKAA